MTQIFFSFLNLDQNLIFCLLPFRSYSFKKDQNIPCQSASSKNTSRYSIWSVQIEISVSVLLLFHQIASTKMIDHKGCSAHTLLSLCVCLLAVETLCKFEQSLMEEQLTNGDFADPQVAYSDYFPLSISGWQCSQQCQIDNCEQRIIQNLRVYNEHFVNCVGQAIDINSNGVVSNISQSVYLQSRTYRVSFDYYYPYERANEKVLSVYFNQQLIFYQHPQVTSHFSRLFYSANLNAREGSNTLLFHNSGEVSDSMGFRISNVSLRQVFWPQFESWLNTSLSNALCTSIIAIPGIRGVLGDLLNMFVSLDRFQLYLYHNRTYAYHALLLLQNVNELLALKGSLAHVTLSTLAPSLLAKCESFARSITFKNSYAHLLIAREPENGFGFVPNNESLMLYSAPFCLLLFVAFNLVFRALFRWPLSKLFRKFCFAGLLLWMVCEGNVEVFTFYVFGEFLTFSSSSFLHRCVNMFISVFYFSVVFTAVAAIWWFRFHYGARFRYFLDDSKFCALSVWSVFVDHGIVSVVSGAMHQTLKNTPNLQLYSLGAVELVWMILRLFFAIKGVYRRRLYVFFALFDSGLRIAFQVQAYLFNNRLEFRSLLNDEVMSIIIYVFLGLFYTQVLLAVLYALYDLYQILRIPKLNENQIVPSEDRQDQNYRQNYERELKINQQHALELKMNMLKRRHFYFEQFLNSTFMKKEKTDIIKQTITKQDNKAITINHNVDIGVIEIKKIAVNRIKRSFYQRKQSKS